MATDNAARHAARHAAVAAACEAIAEAFPWYDPAVYADTKALSTACACKNLDLVTSILKKGANPDNLVVVPVFIPDDPAEPPGTLTTTALHISSQINLPEFLAVLLDHGADINIRDSKGESPLITAVSENSGDCARLLLERGADVTIASDSGETALHAACRNAHAEMAALLLDRGADVNARDHDEATPILAAAATGSTGCVQLLFDRGADIHAADKNGRQALHAAAAAAATANDAGDRVVVDVDVANSKGVTPLAAAVMGGHLDCVVALLEAGADPNVERFDGHTLLTFAAANGLVDMIRLLVASGRADVNRVSSEGFTPMMVAQHFMHKEIVEALVEAGATRGTSALSCAIS
ncbi:ankyrin repeat-containing domain protein [Zopfochytrium polystomum]|nr:ankyrin repeat-containing domain protein [Zopfochytrium polystomum]